MLDQKEKQIWWTYLSVVMNIHCRQSNIRIHT